MRTSMFRIMQYAIGWPLSLVALYFIFTRIFPEFSTVRRLLQEANLPLLVYAIFFFVSYYLLRCVLWHAILKALSHEISLKKTTRLWALSEVNRYIPGNVWSFLGRTVLFNQENIPKKDIATALLVEAQLVLIGAVVVSLLAASFILHQFIPSFENPISVLLLTVSMFLLTFLYIFQERLFQHVSFLKHRYLTHFFPKFPSNRQATLVGISILTMVAFGLGYFFAITAVISLDITYVYTFIGVFVFSLLAGYVSVITPTGLGVREGVIVLLLTPFTTFSVAGFASIFARIILILSELLFIVSVTIVSSFKFPLMTELGRKIRTHPFELLLALSVLVYSLYFSTASILRFENFYAGRFDLGNMAQTVWNSSQGRLFEFTDPDSTQEISRLVYHADVILVLLVPFYLLFPYPATLLVIQAFVVGCGAFFVYAIAKHVLRSNSVSFVFAIAYLLNPSVQRANLYDFHAVVLATTFLLGTFYFMVKKRYVWFGVFALLAGITKEHVWAITALFGLYIVFVQRRFKEGLVTLALSTVLIYFLIWHVIPSARGGNHFALEYYSDFGDSPSSLIKNIFLSPVKTLQVLLQQDRIEYIKQLFGPLGYIPFLAPVFLIFAAPDFLINMLSSNQNLHQIYYQYTATITPFLFIAGIYGFSLFLKFLPFIDKRFLMGVLVFFVIRGAYLHGPLPGSKSANLDMFTKQLPYRHDIKQVLAGIPERYSVAASNNIGAHLSNRQRLYTIPVGVDSADVVVFLLTDKGAQPSLLAQKEMAMRLRYNPAFVILYETGDFVVFQKRERAL
ncbi:MAG: DUF2079 domain-containing protein [Candidatus Levybacteria bacterium]|nr:DUF2079 domain-containing protein [Candidatus Levybacteria bacterium]